MLTIQPKFHQNRFHYMTSFGNNNPEIDGTDYLLTEEHQDGFVSDEDKVLADTRANINKTMSNLHEIGNDLPPAAKNVIGGLVTLGTGAVAGISMKFGFSETSRILEKVSNLKSVKNAKGNVKDSFHSIGKFIGKEIDFVKDTKFVKSVSEKVSKVVEKFKATNFGKKVFTFFANIQKSKFVKNIEGFFGKTKDIKGKQIVDKTGDVLGAATGVSTAAAGFISPEAKERNEG